jgi:hypothetical protein
MLDVAQAAPSYPPAPELVAHVAQAQADPQCAIYSAIARRKMPRLHTPGVASEATLSAAPKPFTACCAMASH